MAKRKVPRQECPFCGNSYAHSGLTRHWPACDALKAMLTPEDAEGATPAKFYHLLVEGSYNPIFWLHLQLSADLTLAELDQLLRHIWLECCGHLSAFRIDDKHYICLELDNWWNPDDETMDHALDEVLSPGLKFSHEYDFGTTTYLTLKVISEGEGPVSEEEPIRLLARNELPDFRCEVCEAPATVICTWCDYTLLCDECTETHECGDEGLLPVVNSPRMGMCGYTGDAW